MYATEAQAAILRAAVAEIKKHPETFDMSTWTCGTTCCLAGQIVRNAVDDWQWDEIREIEARRDLALQAGDVAFPIRDRAVQLLGLDWNEERDADEEDQLFHVDSWPESFRPAIDDGLYGPVSPEQLKARVEWWIETGE
jgi:hypothetical protein